jgi:TRAP-type C4-dicarboxylate transport system permease large subunit
MEQLYLSILLIVALFAFLGSGIWVAVSLLAVGFVGMTLFTDAPVGQVMATTIWGASNSWALAALPMFIWMGEILFRSRLSKDLFGGLAPWMGWLPGRLMHVNILGCGVFAAVSGSSAATAATIGKMSLPELEKRGYDRRMSIGTLAGSGTLGLLIPPSIILIVYGVATEQSIARLFIAGVLPGVMLVGLFMGYVVIWALLNPSKNPPGGFEWSRVFASRRILSAVFAAAIALAGVIWVYEAGLAPFWTTAAAGLVAGAALMLLAVQPMPGDAVAAGLALFARGLSVRVVASARLIPVLLLIAGVIGSIYFGYASPTDAAAVGVMLSLGLSWMYGDLNRKTFVAGLMGATTTSCMIAFILAGAAFLTVAMGFTGIPRSLATWIDSMQLSPYMLLAALTIFFVILGCFLDGISVVVLTTAVILPMVEVAGIDTIWFGIYLVIVVEMSQITPPVGFNLFVLQGLTGEDILQVAHAALPFFFLLMIAVALIVAFPEIATYLPDAMLSRSTGG